MKQVSTIAATPGFPVTLDRHTFRASKDGQLEHLVNDEVRAVIPPKGFAAYLEDWPQALPVIESIGAPAAAAAVAGLEL